MDHYQWRQPSKLPVSREIRLKACLPQGSGNGVGGETGAVSSLALPLSSLSGPCRTVQVLPAYVVSGSLQLLATLLHLLAWGSYDLCIAAAPQPDELVVTGSGS
jgi:hypothetical protein